MFFNKVLQMDLGDADILACKLEHIIGENISSRLAFLAENIMENPACEELRKIIEERKQKELAARKAMKENSEKETQSHNVKKEMIIPNRGIDRSR
jgi:Mn-dependent DtxR family transcriptional regulator